MIGVSPRHRNLVRHATLVSQVILAVDWLVMTIMEDSDGSIGLGGLQSRLDRRTVGWRYSIAISVDILLEHGARALSSMATATSLLLRDGSQMRLVRDSVVTKACFQPLLRLA